jgi:hypothetical protein
MKLKKILSSKIKNINIKLPGTKHWRSSEKIALEYSKRQKTKVTLKIKFEAIFIFDCNAMKDDKSVIFESANK